MKPLEFILYYPIENPDDFTVKVSEYGNIEGVRLNKKVKLNIGGIWSGKIHFSTLKGDIKLDHVSDRIYKYNDKNIIFGEDFLFIFKYYPKHLFLTLL